MPKTSNAAIVFVYNRPEEARRTIDSLSKNVLASKTNLFVFSDAPAKEEAVEGVRQVRAGLENISGFRSVEVIKRELNVGIARSVIGGVTEVLRHYNQVSVFEDDLVTSPHTLTFLRDALSAYRETPKVFSVAAYNHSPEIMPIPKKYRHDVYFTPRSCSYGWGIWKDRWRMVDWLIPGYGNLLCSRVVRRKFELGGEDLPIMLADQLSADIRTWDWDIRLTYIQFLFGAWTVMPVHSYIQNIGFEGGGVHGRNPLAGMVTDLSRAKERCEFPATPMLDLAMMRSFRGVYRRPFRSHAKRFFLSAFTGVLTMSDNLFNTIPPF